MAGPNEGTVKNRSGNRASEAERLLRRAAQREQETVGTGGEASAEALAATSEAALGALNGTASSVAATTHLADVGLEASSQAGLRTDRAAQAVGNSTGKGGVGQWLSGAWNRTALAMGWKELPLTLPADSLAGRHAEPFVEDSLQRNLEKTAMKRDVMPLQAALAKLDELDRYMPVPAGKRKASLSAEELKKLYRDTANHPVANPMYTDRYGTAGFCFGRAMTAHLLALRMGLDKDAIRKVWIVGNLRGRDGTPWNFHVTTAVRGPDGWYAIDSAFGPLKRISKWRKDFEDWIVVNGQTFVTQPARFLAGSAAGYRHEALEDPDLGGYFVELMAQFRKDWQAAKQAPDTPEVLDVAEDAPMTWFERMVQRFSGGP